MANNLQVAKNMVFSFLGFGINFGLSFFLTPYLIRTLGTEAYSFFPLTNSLIGYTSILTSAVGSMAGRFIIMEFYGGSMEKAKTYYNTVIVAYLALSVLFTLIALGVIINLELLINIPDYLVTDVKWLFAFSAICLIVALPLGILGVGLSVKNKNHLDSMSGITCSFGRAAAIVLLFWLLPANIVYIGLAGVVAMVISLVYRFYFKRRFLPEISFQPKRYFSFKAIGTLVSSGMWNSVNQLSGILQLQFDLLLANIFISAMAMGQYAIAKTIPNLLLTIVGLLSAAFMPQMNILYAQNNKEEVLHEVNKSIKVISALISIPLGILIIYGKDFFLLWVPSEDCNLLALMSTIILLPMIISTSVNPIFGVFTITNKLKVPALALLIGATLQTILALLLLKYTSIGLLAFPISFAINLCIRNFFFTPQYAAYCLGYSRHYFYPSILKGFMGLVTVLLISFSIKEVIQVRNWGEFFLSASVAGLLCLGANSLILFKKSERALVYRKVINVLQ